MARDVQAYFAETVIPLISSRLPDVAREMSIQLLGSYGLGIADEWSDLDALIYLDAPLWKSHGGQLQLLLDEELPRFGTETTHADICVWPTSWLGQLNGFLADDRTPPWEEETIERLFEVQTNLVLADPHGLFRRLRDATRPERFPEWLWQKRLIHLLRSLCEDDLPEYRQCLRRGLWAECGILLGILVHKLLQVGFLFHKRYYPWRTHLCWAFEKLPEPAGDVLHRIARISSQATNPNNLVEIDAVLDTYCEQMARQGVLPNVNLLSSDLGRIAELVWAQRCEAWSKPNWRDRVVQCQQRAQKAGHANEWWVWSLWGWK